MIHALWRELLGEISWWFSTVAHLLSRTLLRLPTSGGQHPHEVGANRDTSDWPELLKARLRPSQDERNFEQWVSNRFGQRLYQIFFKTYTEKVWNTMHGDFYRLGRTTY